MRKSKLVNLLPAVAIYLLVEIYIYSSWGVWWFGGSFGQRSMIQSYALLIFPFTFSIVFLLEKKVIRPLLIVFLLACTFLNLLFSWEYKNNLLLTDGINKSMLKSAVLYPADSYIPVSKRIYDMQWKDEYIDSKIKIIDDTNSRVLHNGDFSELLSTEVSKIKNSYGWIRCSYEVRYKRGVSLQPNNLHLVSEVSNKGRVRFWKGKYFTDQFGKIFKYSGWVERIIDFRIPANAYNEDFYKLYFWQTQEQEVQIRNIKVFGLNIKN
jgi:hypothetical protein